MHSISRSCDRCSRLRWSCFFGSQCRHQPIPCAGRRHSRGRPTFDFTPDALARDPQLRHFCRTGFAIRQMLFDQGLFVAVCFPIHITRQQRSYITTVHSSTSFAGAVSSISTLKRWLRVRSARSSRDFTVPSGISSASAISAYGRSP